MAKVLIVDDEKSIRNTVSEFLRMDGYEVRTAEDADAAMALLSEQPFDVVITDIVLPRVSGVTLLQRIKARASDIQVIMMTGEPTVDTAVEAVRAGASDYLSKPVGKRELLAVVGHAATYKALLDEKVRLEADNRRYQEGLEADGGGADRGTGDPHQAAGGGARSCGGDQPRDESGDRAHPHHAASEGTCRGAVRHGVSLE